MRKYVLYVDDTPASRAVEAAVRAAGVAVKVVYGSTQYDPLPTYEAPGGVFNDIRRYLLPDLPDPSALEPPSS